MPGDDGGTTPGGPDTPAAESPLPVPDLPLSTPAAPPPPDAEPLLATPLPICIRPLVC